MCLALRSKRDVCCSSEFMQCLGVQICKDKIEFNQMLKITVGYTSKKIKLTVGKGQDKSKSE